MTLRAPPLAPEVWLVHLWAPPPHEARLHALLEPEERDRLARFAFPWLRTRYAVAHAAVRTLAARHGAGPPAAQRWAKGPHGKPYLPGLPLELNLSHAGDWALVAIGHDRAVGVDLEAIAPQRVSPGMVRMVTSSTEAAAIARLPAHEHAAAFFRLWVRKEAVIKALGTGLARRLDTIDVPLQARAPPDGVVLRPAPSGARLWLWDLPAPTGYLAALAVQQPEGERPRAPAPLRWLGLDALDPP